MEVASSAAINVITDKLANAARNLHPGLKASWTGFGDTFEPGSALAIGGSSDLNLSFKETDDGVDMLGNFSRLQAVLDPLSACKRKCFKFPSRLYLFFQF